MELIARTLRGLEWVSAAEIERRFPDARRIRMGNREVTFEYDGPAAALLRLQTVDDLFVVISRIDDVGATKGAVARLAQRVRGLDWDEALHRLSAARTAPDEFFFDVVASIEGDHRYSRFDVENAVGEQVAPLWGATHLARTAEGLSSSERPDVTVRLFVKQGAAVVAVRLSAAPLHRRPYKHDTAPGTLHPPAAAALVAIAGMRAETRAFDPFCGDGTIAIEAGLQHPGIAFHASDLDPARVENTRRNAARAGVEIDTGIEDAARIPWDRRGPGAVVITNPPWNNAVRAAGGVSDSLDVVWRSARPALRGGRLCVLADAKLDIPTRLAHLGYRRGFSTRIRLAGRVTSLILTGVQGDDRPELPHDLGEWRRRAIDARVVGPEGL
ncbi:methyltransferase [Ruania albidiflava]|uniref:methyltransferase n=1 Tax=Ruania albidiflava TaxID=366586 RepID=UPI001FE05482|nr:methyltransferase [Ruania albidiflava]